MTVILCFLIRKATPFESCAATLRERSTIFAKIEAKIVGREAEFVQPVHQVPDFGGAQQRLGRNAAPVQADAAELFALDDGCLQAELRAADGADIACGPAADDKDIVLIRH